jgi:hypothetical protein
MCRGFESHCETWVPVFRIRPYKPRSCVAVGVKEHSLLKAMSAKHRSKFAARSQIMVTAAR